MGALLGAAVVGAVVGITVRGANPAPASPGAPSVATATVVRTDLSSTTLVQGTLGYAPTDPVVNRLTGTYTWLAAPETTVDPDQTLFEVDDQPVVLLSGTTPAWRTFGPGMADGPDVTELESSLIATGDAAGLFSVPAAHFSALTSVAVARWQSRLGLPADGQVVLGRVVFLPGPVVVRAATVAAGQAAAPGDIPYQVTTATRVVTVPVTPSVPDTHVGESVSIVLPSGAATGGHVVGIGPPPPSTGTSSSGSSSAGTNNGTANTGQASASIVIAPDAPTATGGGVGVSVEVSVPVESATSVLAVPIAALLALAGGGYGLEVVGHAGAHHLVAVTTGLFTGSQVQINGSGIDAGTKVVVSQ
jgi:hypothetical protein